MKILILSPLFPPDVGDPAEYVKELASRLPAADTTLLVYGYLPETVTGTPVKAIDKRNRLFFRLAHFTFELLKASKNTELIIVNNAPSTELPALIVSLFRPQPMLLCISDSIAANASGRGIYGLVHILLKRRCKKIISLPTDHIYQRAELLPFATFDTTREAARQAWWQKHLTDIQSL